MGPLHGIRVIDLTMWAFVRVARGCSSTSSCRAASCPQWPRREAPTCVCAGKVTAEQITLEPDQAVSLTHAVNLPIEKFNDGLIRLIPASSEP